MVLSTSTGKALPFVLCVLSAVGSQTMSALPTKIKIKSKKFSFKEQFDADTDSSISTFVIICSIFTWHSYSFHSNGHSIYCISAAKIPPASHTAAVLLKIRSLNNINAFKSF